MVSELICAYVLLPITSSFILLTKQHSLCLVDEQRFQFMVFFSSVLAFSLGDTKQVVLCDVEKAEILHVFPVETAVSCMHWMEVLEESR